MEKKFNFSINFNSGSIDREKGEIKKVSIITEGPALGHGVNIDAKTISGLYDLINGKTVKSYLKHDWADRLSEEIGLFSAFHIDGEQLRGTFTALKAFKKHNEKEFDTLFELAETSPDNFGTSISFSGYLVYFENGEEKNYTGEEDVEEIFVRVAELHSIDWVGSPAANPTGVFSNKDKDMDIKEQLAAKEAELETVKEQFETELATAKEALEADLAGVKAELEAEKAKSAQLETELEAEKAKATEIEQKYSELKASGNEVITDNKDDILATYQAISDRQERLQYFRKHKAELLKHV